jgi:aminoglycoside phosphotransferase (APT) family kinase protein
VSTATTRRNGTLLAQGRQAEIFAWDEGRVLKLLRRAEAEGEARSESALTRQAHAAGAPAPAVYETVWVEGRPGIVFERLSGPTMLALLTAQPWWVIRLARQLAEVHVRLHRCSGAGLPPQAERVARLARWVKTAALFDEATREQVLNRLVRVPEGDRVCHGDFHPDNVVLTPRGPVVVDWTNAWCGHPLADVARTAVILQLGELPPGAVQRLLLTVGRGLFHHFYLDHYFRLQTDYTRSELNAWRMPIAVGRLTDGIEPERPRLLALIKTLAQAA